MQAAAHHHQRTQELLLVSRLLDCRDNSSPFTLVIDSLEQSAAPLMANYVARARTIQNSQTQVVFVCFETIRPPAGAHHLIQARGVDLDVLRRKVQGQCSQASKHLVIIDTLHPIFSAPKVSDPAAWLSSFISPTTQILAVHHSSLPIFPAGRNPYQPDPVTLLRYVATTVLTTHSLSHVLAAKAARDRSRAVPQHGLSEEEEGTVQGLGANDRRGVVVECEMRRRSGRAVEIWFVLDCVPPPSGVAEPSASKRREPFSGIVLLEDHPLYREPTHVAVERGNRRDESEHGELSFSLDLTDRQRRDREELVLPYFDAQGSDGPGEGGRILYDMGVEDDFDDEEDEL